MSRRRIFFHEGAILAAAFASTAGFSELVPVAQAVTENEASEGVREDSKLRGRQGRKELGLRMNFALCCQTFLLLLLLSSIDA